MNGRSPLVVLGALGGTALFLTALPACTASDTASKEERPELARFYQQKLTWSGCEGDDRLEGMECAKLTVPVDYTDPKSGTIAVAVGRYRSTAGPNAAAAPSGSAPPSGSTARIGSLVFNFGGPGMSGLTGLADAREDYRALRAHYDLVSFDPRGVGRSAPVKCGTALDGGEDDTDQGDELPTDAAGRAALVKELTSIAAQCAAGTGKVLPFVGTVNTSRDMDVLRQALGDDKLHYFGTSYGTRLGAVYAKQFPDRAGRLALDAVDTLTENSRASALTQARAFQKALESFVDDCAGQGEKCPIGATEAAAVRTVDETVARITEAPVESADGSPFTVRDLRTAISNSLYSAELHPTLAEGIARLHDSEDPAVLVEINRAFAGEDEEGNRDEADNSDEAILAINCADDPDRPADPAAEIASLEEEFTEASSVFGTEMAREAVSCTGWPAGSDYIRKIEDTGGPKVLLIGTKGDPATPYQWTGETAKRLGNAVVLTYEGEGHGAYSASTCVRAKTDAYLIEGKLPADGTSCPAEAPEADARDADDAG
ncbi:alpha/beta hydrolase [Streptomyces sp. NPDC050504]|uniref:alpha/beta hydrolase n=1 Tax=Streptomyces sp. NPDC050504 TaxID=3365618 RepID=UPI0037AC15B0